MLSILPPELVSAIIEQVVDRTTLLSLCLTSKATSAEAPRWLYSNITDNLDRNADRHYRLLETLVARPYLASFVHSYTIDSVASVCKNVEDDTSFDDPGSKEPLNTASLLWIILPQALSLMSNLEYLSFRAFAADPSAYWLLRKATFQLKEMHWEARQEGKAMATFLSTQRRLETLYLSDGLSHPVDPKACLALRLLGGNSTTFGRILPGRPLVTNLDWLSSGREYIEHPLLPALLPELHRITHFSTEGFSARLRLPTFGGHFRDLVAMKLNYIYEPEIPVIFTIPKLKILVLSTLYFASTEEGLIRKPASVLQRLFDGTPPLCTIVTDKMSTSPEGLTRMLYYWWKRAAPVVSATWHHQTKRWPGIEDFSFEGHIEESPPGWTIYHGGD